jgi:RecJ-like exonuclease
MRFPFPPARQRLLPTAKVESEPEQGPELAYDDEADHDRCEDCHGTGWYVGLVERRYCPTCDGSGYL